MNDIITKNDRAFTLIELIIVITILAILGMIGYVSFGNYTLQARNSARYNDVNNIKKALELTTINSGTYPSPDGKTISYSGSNLWNYGDFDQKVVDKIPSLGAIPVDPSTRIPYEYSKSLTTPEYQIKYNLETPSGKDTTILDGNYNGIFIKNGNNFYTIPSLFTTLSGATNNDILTASTIGFDINSHTDKVTFTPKALALTGSTDNNYINFTQDLINAYKGNTTLSEINNISTLLSYEEKTDDDKINYAVGLTSSSSELVKIDPRILAASKLSSNNTGNSSGIKKISVGGTHALILKEDGTVWGVGSNTFGELGIGNTEDQEKPVQITSLSNIVDIFVGNSCSFALKDNGTIWSFGYNLDGQLGIGNTEDQEEPVQITSLSGVKSISVGPLYTIALKQDGTVRSFGDNTFGQLGIGNTDNQLSPVQITSLSNVKNISAGGNHLLILKEDGTVWGTGISMLGTLGIGSTDNQLSPVQITSLSNVKNISAGGSHSLILKEDGTVWSFGSNINTGALGLGNIGYINSPTQITSLSNIKDIITGSTTSFALNENGTLWGFGSNQYGQLGVGSTDELIPLPTQITTISNIQDITASDFNTLIIKKDNSIWGTGVLAMLGFGYSENQIAPVEIDFFGN